MKRLVCALLLILLPFLPAMAENEQSPLQVVVSPHQAEISFSLTDTTYAHLTVTTKNDTFEQLIYSEDGNFAYTASLPNCFEETQLTVEVRTLGGKRVLRHIGKTAVAEQTNAPAPNLEAPVRIAGSARDAVITMVKGGLDYSFNVPGRDSVYFRVKSPQETHTYTLFAGEEYVYTGHIDLPHTFPEDNVTVTIADRDGNLLETRITERDDDGLELKVKGLKYGEEYTATVTGAALRGSGIFNEVKAEFTAR